MGRQVAVVLYVVAMSAVFAGGSGNRPSRLKRILKKTACSRLPI